MSVWAVLAVLVGAVLYLNMGYGVALFNQWLYQRGQPKWLLGLFWPVTKGSASVHPDLRAQPLVEVWPAKLYLRAMAVGGWWMKLVFNVLLYLWHIIRDPSGALTYPVRWIILWSPLRRIKAAIEKHRHRPESDTQ